MANFIDDIPEARRETLITSTEPAAKSSSSVTPWVLLGLAILAVGGMGIWWLRPTAPQADIPEVEPTATATIDSAVAAEATEGAKTTNVNLENTSDNAPTSSLGSTESSTSDSLLGHRPYPIADINNLIALSTNSMVLLKPEVAQKVELMMADAGAVGVPLDVISGFRSLEDQRYLFFDLKAERGQTPQTRAEVSAPPGYSEHHTGYAVDFIDPSQPATDLNASFEQTQAFRWLDENAAYYGFEMSFTKDNQQNVAYEPWHWRYVGNQESLELFYQD